MCRFIILLIFFIFHFTYADTQDDHLQELKKAFPHALLTDDYGILSKDDLEINSCIGPAEAFSEENSAYPYWQCFDLKNSRMKCENPKFDPDAKERMTIMVLSAKKDQTLHEYLSRRPMPLKACRLYRKEWKKFTQNETHVCISGTSSSKNIENKKTKWISIFGRHKTKKGCDFYFVRECRLSYKLKHVQCDLKPESMLSQKKQAHQS